MLRTILTTAAITASLAMAGTADARVTCQEDQPCWNWATMGNQERGVHVIDDTPDLGRAIPNRPGMLSVTPCEYSYLWHEGYLTRGNKRLRGDRLARRHGCDYRYFA